MHVTELPLQLLMLSSSGRSFQREHAVLIRPLLCTLGPAQKCGHAGEGAGTPGTEQACFVAAVVNGIARIALVGPAASQW